MRKQALLHDNNAAPLHFAAMHGDLETIRLLAEAGADVEGKGMTTRSESWVGRPDSVKCERSGPVLLSRGAMLNLWTAIALDRVDNVRAMLVHDPALLAARMTRNVFSG